MKSIVLMMASSLIGQTSASFEAEVKAKIAASLFMQSIQNVENHKQAVSDDYEFLRSKAIREDKPFVVFAGCAEVKGDWVGYECGLPFAWAATPRVIISEPRNGDLFVIAELPPNQTAASIRLRLTPRPVFRSAIPREFCST